MPRFPLSLLIAGVLAGAPQEQAIAPSVTVQLGSLKLLHRAALQYPAEAVAKGVQGDVVLELALGDTGIVEDARVLSGPMELRAVSLRSVLQWHFVNETHKATKGELKIEFRFPRSASGLPEGGVQSVLRQAVVNAKVAHIAMAVPEEISQRLEGHLPIHVGDQLTSSVFADLQRYITSVDEHLRVNILDPAGQNGVTVNIHIAASIGFPEGEPGRRLWVGGNAQAGILVSKVAPIYPIEAKAGRIQGTVSFTAIISSDGHVASLQLMSGHPLLVEAARNAVMQWVYKPTLLHGELMEVATQIDVNFTLDY
jgi:outer membrane biosynthesis protein TonB